MANYDEALATFVGVHGEGAVLSALKAYTASRKRLEKYADKYAEARKKKAVERKEQNQFAKELAKAASTPDGAAKVRELLAAKGITL